MSRAPSYRDACRPQPREVAGIGLVVFTVGHALALRHLGSPLLPDDSDRDPEVGLGDLALALAVCERQFATSNDRALSKRTVTIANQLTRRHRKHSAEWWEAMLVAEFRDYLAESMAGPVFTVKAEYQSGRSGGADWLQGLILDLMSAGYTHGEVLEMPFGKARWDWSAYWEKQGRIEIESDEDREFMAWADKVAAEAEQQ